MTLPQILIVDDNADMRALISQWLQDEDYPCDEAPNGSKALAMLENHQYNVVLLDIRLPDMDGFAVIKQIQKEFPDTCVIMLTAFDDQEMSTRALDAGAFEYFPKPIHFDLLLPTIHKALHQFSTSRECQYQTEEEQRKYTFTNIIGESEPMQKMLELIKKVAATDATALILGETGTGKELVAGAIHYNSPRCNTNLLVADCSTIAPNLIESELFGHEKGAFTTAIARRKGKFERADGGTLFIDEIGELEPHMQMKMLRFLQEGTIERVGGDEVIKVDARVLAATAVNIKQAIESGSFREDLYFRLNVVTINIPPLRERKTDIPLLVDHFIRLYSRKYNKKNITAISPSALSILDHYDFPGNVRELESIIKRSIVLCEGSEIERNDIVFDPIKAQNGFMKEYFELPIKQFMVACEKEYLIRLLNKLDWQMGKASIAAGIDRTTLYTKLKTYHIKKP